MTVKQAIKESLEWRVISIIITFILTYVFTGHILNSTVFTLLLHWVLFLSQVLYLIIRK